jgi:hypothetical protein
MCVVLGEREASQPLDMTDYIRIINIPWFIVLFLFWLFRFKEPASDKLKTSCQRRTPGWYVNHVGELLAVGYLTGFGFTWFAIEFKWATWTGEDDITVPGWCWAIGLGFGLFNFACQHFSRDGRASKLATAAVGSAVLFCYFTVILHWRSQGLGMTGWETWMSLLVILGLVAIAIAANWIAILLPGDVALSLSMPVIMLFLIYGVEVFPAPYKLEFFVAVCVGFGLALFRIALLPFFIKPETMCCVEANQGSEDQVETLKKEVKKLKNKVDKKPKKPKKTLSETFTESFEDAYTAAKKRQQNNGWDHDYELASTTITSEDPESEGEESVVWGVIPPRDPFDEADR